MSTVTVNKLDKQNDESEFEIETLDDISSMTGGASTVSSVTPNLSVPLNNNSIKVNSLEKENANPIKSEKVQSATITSTKPSSIQESAKSNTPVSSAKPDEEDESEFPVEENAEKEANEANTHTPKSSMSKSQSIQEEDKELAGNLESMQKLNSTPEVNTTQKTKKKVKKVNKVKKVGATKKKVVAPQIPSTVANNNVQPHVEFGNERGTMTIKYASAKTTVPLYSSAKASHLDLAGLKLAFDTEYDTVKAMTADQVTELRHEMQNTEFTELGSEALIHGLLSIIDDHDTKKLTLKMMLARGLLKVKA
jgi:hypothetical protein